VSRPLIGSDEQGRPVCGPCAGAPGLDYTCRECGRGGEIHSSRRCFRCVLADRTQTLLAGPGGEVSAQLLPLIEALTAVTNPATVVKWLGTSRSARLLGHLARTGDPITHELLDDLPQTQALHYVREVLVSSGVLPARNEHLERLAPWLENLLAGKPAHHARPSASGYGRWFMIWTTTTRVSSAWSPCSAGRTTGSAARTRRRSTTPRWLRSSWKIGQDPASGPYAYYCGASHAELWRIQHSYDEVQRPDGQVVWIPSAPVATVNAAVSVCADAHRTPLPQTAVAVRADTAMMSLIWPTNENRVHRAKYAASVSTAGDLLTEPAKPANRY
jgi:hypothetical protein